MKLLGDKTLIKIKYYSVAQSTSINQRKFFGRKTAKKNTTSRNLPEFANISWSFWHWSRSIAFWVYLVYSTYILNSAFWRLSVSGGILNELIIYSFILKILCEVSGRVCSGFIKAFLRHVECFESLHKHPFVIFELFFVFSSISCRSFPCRFKRISKCF